MGLIHTIKSAILTRLLRRPAVLDAATGVILSDPTRAHRIVANPEQFAQILEAISKSQQAATTALEHPEVRKRIVRNPNFFEAMLAHTAHQPEALSRILARRETRKNLSAQKGFLSAMANEERVVLELMKALPSRLFQTALAALLARHSSQIEAIEDSPEAFAAALLAGVEQDPEKGAKDADFINLLAAKLGRDIGPVLQAIAAQKPEIMVELLGSGKMRDLMVQAVSSDIDAIQAAFGQYILQPGRDQSATDRAAELIKTVTTDPEFLRAAARDPDIVGAFLQSDKMRDLLIMTLSTDKKTVQDLFRQYVAMPSAGPSLPDRIVSLTDVIMSDPVFIRAMSRDTDLQVRLLQIVTEAFDQVGEDIDDVRRKAAQLARLEANDHVGQTPAE